LIGPRECGMQMQVCRDVVDLPNEIGQRKGAQQAGAAEKGGRGGE
jgi:hypothetical protein